MGRASNHPPELRERAVRLVAEVTPGYPSQWSAITAVAQLSTRKRQHADEAADVNREREAAQK